MNSEKGQKTKKICHLVSKAVSAQNRFGTYCFDRDNGISLCHFLLVYDISSCRFVLVHGIFSCRFLLLHGNPSCRHLFLRFLITFTAMHFSALHCYILYCYICLWLTFHAGSHLKGHIAN